VTVSLKARLAGCWLNPDGWALRARRSLRLLTARQGGRL